MQGHEASVLHAVESDGHVKLTWLVAAHRRAKERPCVTAGSSGLDHWQFKLDGGCPAAGGVRTRRTSFGYRNARWHRCRVTMTPVPLQCQIVACSAIAVPKQCHCSANESLGTSETPRWPSSRRFQPAQLARIGGKPQVSAGQFSPAIAHHHFSRRNSLSRRTKLAAAR